MPFRMVRLYIGNDGQSHVVEEALALAPVDAVTAAAPAQSVVDLTFEETRSRSSLSWHTAPRRQYVITLSGTLEFKTRDGSRFLLGRGTSCSPRTPPDSDGCLLHKLL